MAKVLVVEDDPEIRSVVGKLLEEAGYAVALACDGAAALDQVRLAPPDCVLLDFHMPRMDRPSFLAAWRAQPGYRKVPVILFTSAFEGVTAAAALQVQGYISKPFDLDAVLETISRVLDASLPGQYEPDLERVDDIDRTTDGLVPRASSARVPVGVAALRERARWTLQSIARSQRTILWAQSYLDRVWAQSNS